MNLFRLFLVVHLVALVVYSIVVGSNHGLNLFPIFFGDIMAMTWPGQFNFDFLGFLFLSAIWVIWRNQFTPVALLLGLIAFTGGMGFLTIYLLYLSFKTNGNVPQMMLGEQRASA